MITQTVTVKEKDTQNIIIGRRGTWDTEQIVFDVSYLIESYGSGSAELLVKRPVDETAYPAVTTLEGNLLTWAVSDVDTVYKGHGECELYWYVGNALAKSVIYSIAILRDIGETTETPPDPYETWIDHLVDLASETQQNAQAAAESAQEAETAQGKAEDAQEKAEEAQEKAETAESNAKTSEENANRDALKAEGWAIGEQDGVPAQSGSPYYHNSSKFWAELSQQGAIESGFAFFDIEDETGIMYVYITDSLAEDVSFEIDEETGILEVIYA